MSEELRRRLASLEQEILSVRDEIKRTLSEIYDLERRRKNLLIRVRELKVELTSYKNRLNVLREEIKSLNESLSKFRREKEEKITSLKDLKKKIREYLKMKPRREKEDLELEISNLEWRIQTMPIPLDEEKKIVAKVKSLEEQLYFYKRLRLMENEVQSMEKTIEEIKWKIRTCLKEISEKISERLKVQERLAEIGREINKIKSELNGINREYTGKKLKISELRLKQGELLSQIMMIKKTIKEGEEKRKAEQESILKEKIKKKVSEKIKRGEKVSFEELKIFFEENTADNV